MLQSGGLRKRHPTTKCSHLDASSRALTAYKHVLASPNVDQVPLPEARGPLSSPPPAPRATTPVASPQTCQPTNCSPNPPKSVARGGSSQDPLCHPMQIQQREAQALRKSNCAFSPLITPASRQGPMLGGYTGGSTLGSIRGPRLSCSCLMIHHQHGHFPALSTLRVPLRRPQFASLSALSILEAAERTVRVPADCSDSRTVFVMVWVLVYGKKTTPFRRMTPPAPSPALGVAEGCSLMSAPMPLVSSEVAFSKKRRNGDVLRLPPATNAK